MIPCDRCGKGTKEKIITSKKEDTFGNKYTVLQCLGGCMNGKYPYTFFPPRETEQAPPSPPSWDDRQRFQQPQPFPEVKPFSTSPAAPAPLNGYSNEAALSVIASELRQLRMAIQSIFGKNYEGVPKVQTVSSDLADEVQFQ